MVDTDIAWLAGLLEGEGCFVISWKTSKGGSYPAFRISCNMCDGDVLQRVYDVFGGRLSMPLPVKNPKHRPVFRWNCHKRSDVKSICEKILPLMGVRRSSRITEMLDVMDRFPARSKWRHGTRQGYEAGGCRCDACKSANAKRFMDRRRARGISAKVLKCGTRSSYNKGCRCEECMRVSREYSASRRKNRDASDV